MYGTNIPPLIHSIECHSWRITIFHHYLFCRNIWRNNFFVGYIGDDIRQSARLAFTCSIRNVFAFYIIHISIIIIESGLNFSEMFLCLKNSSLQRVSFCDYFYFVQRLHFVYGSRTNGFLLENIPLGFNFTQNCLPVRLGLASIFAEFPQSEKFPSMECEWFTVKQ